MLHPQAMAIIPEIQHALNTGICVSYQIKFKTVFTVVQIKGNFLTVELKNATDADLLPDGVYRTSKTTLGINLTNELIHYINFWFLRD